MKRSQQKIEKRRRVGSRRSRPIAPIAAHGGRIGDSWRSPTFIASTDCVYWQQGKCGEDWAEGCKLFVQRNATHEVAAIRWLSELYVREPD